MLIEKQNPTKSSEREEKKSNSNSNSEYYESVHAQLQVKIVNSQFTSLQARALCLSCKFHSVFSDELRKHRTQCKMMHAVTREKRTGMRMRMQRLSSAEREREGRS